MKKSELKKLKEKFEKKIDDTPQLVLKKISNDGFFRISQKVVNSSSLNMHIYQVKGKIDLIDGHPSISYKVSNPNILTPVAIAIAFAMLPVLAIITMGSAPSVLVMAILSFVVIVALMWRAASGQEKRWREEGEAEMKKILSFLIANRNPSIHSS